jgi:DNA repair protein RecO (recombination protein O)
MPNIVKTEGIVLKGMDFRETSRIVTVYTKKFGKVKVLAKGIRRPKSKFGSALETLTRSHIVFYKREQKDLYTLSESDILESHDDLRKNLLGFSYSSVLLDFLDKANPGEESNPRLYRLSAGTLSAMERCVQMRSVECGVRNSDPELVSGHTPNSEFQMLLWGFLWRGISYVGFKPELERCVGCKTKINTPTRLPIHNLTDSSTVIAMVAPKAPPEAIPSFRWSSSLGGILCSDCRGKDEEGREISANTLKLLKTLKNGSDPIGTNQINESMNEIKYLIKNYLSYHLDKELLSFKFIRSLQNLPT